MAENATEDIAETFRYDAVVKHGKTAGTFVSASAPPDRSPGHG